MLPLVKEYNSIESSGKHMLIVSEGFETRSISWIESLDDDVFFEKAIICQYEPSKQSRFNEVLQLTKKHLHNAPIIIKYNRFEPTIFEKEIRGLFCEADYYTDIYIDISVMSKLLIMIVINELKGYSNNLHIIYTEPVKWGPTKQQFESAMNKRKKGGAICLSSIGVGDIVRTPGLSSIVMQKNPAVLIAGLSFNEQIVNILVNEINPEQLFFINQGCQREEWRENAIVEIHQNIIDEYQQQKRIVEKYLLTEYDKVFEFLVKVYKKYWLTNRIIISPCGYKMHAISFALLKICCPDVHVEYPTPDSYLFEGYSSDRYEHIYELRFTGFSGMLRSLNDYYKLDG